ncbi:MAG: hypothetical protein EOP60_03780 [Sphingomonadales bacterium]|nr:MAG: hypothetical protein EOP60_03780 [Sphingomonadales bacterium]
MTFAIIPLLPLEGGYVKVLRARAAIRSVLLFAAAVGLELFVDWPFPGIVLVPALAFAIWMVGVVPPRRWKHMGYAYTGRELHVASGFLFRSHTVVPVSRVQHIDIVQGPVERFFSLSTLVLNTAGSDASAVVLPGITRETAEEIRDSIRSQIGSALA